MHTISTFSFIENRESFIAKKGLTISYSCLDYSRKLQFVLSAGIEWILDNDASNAAVLVASEAHAITLAIEGLLGVVFTVATLTDEAVDMGEVPTYFVSSFCNFPFFNSLINMSHV